MHSDYHLRHFQMSTTLWTNGHVAWELRSDFPSSPFHRIISLSFPPSLHPFLHLHSPDKTEFFFLSCVSEHSPFSSSQHFSPNQRNMFSSFLSHPSFPLICLFFLSVSFPPQLLYPSCFQQSATSVCSASVSFHPSFVLVLSVVGGCVLLLCFLADTLFLFILPNFSELKEDVLFHPIDITVFSLWFFQFLFLGI